MHLTPDFTADDAVRLMDAHCVSRAVLMQSPYYGCMNDAYLQASRRYPGRFWPSFQYDPFAENERELDACTPAFHLLKFEMSDGYGLCRLHPEAEICDARMHAAYRRARAAGLAVAFDLGERGERSFQPEALASIARAYRDVRFVVCHMAAPWSTGSAYERTLMALRGENVWFDLAAVQFHTENGVEAARKWIARAIELAGESRLIFGTDVPGALAFAKYAAMRAPLDDLPARQMDKVLHQNAVDAYATGKEEWP